MDGEDVLEIQPSEIQAKDGFLKMSESASCPSVATKHRPWTKIDQVARLKSNTLGQFKKKKKSKKKARFMR